MDCTIILPHHHHIRYKRVLNNIIRNFNYIVHHLLIQILLSWSLYIHTTRHKKRREEFLKKFGIIMGKYILFISLMLLLGINIISTTNGQQHHQQQQQQRLRQSRPRNYSPLKSIDDSDIITTTTEAPYNKVYEIRSDISPNIGDGNFKYYVETSDGLHSEQLGYLNKPGVSQVHEGSYTTFDEHGKIITVNYIADKNGFNASPESLPTSPPPQPIPQELIDARENILHQQNLIRQRHLSYFRAAHAPYTQQQQQQKQQS